ncbi:MAG TPA: ABC transporter ATP-binding protein [Candidatus Saccharimonadales bacterium]|nr:ABC transporter ATP-binding protein [Candidatus Saccharimonadales bacterium]
MAQKKAIIELKNITKEYVSLDVVTRVLQGVSLIVNEGDFIAITGPSGSGKSTMMNIIGLLDTPTHGTYMLNGQNTTGLSEDKLAFVRNREIGFVFQSFNLLNRASALENVVLPAIYAGTPNDVRQKKAKDLLTQVGLGERLNNHPNQLSGGQQQRVAIARALMNNPAIILADEPTGNLDSKSGEDVMNILKKLNSEGKTIVLITHELDIAEQAKKIIHFKDGVIVT